MRSRFLMPLAALALLTLISGVQAEDKAGPAKALIEKLNTDDAAKRAAAETEIRDLGEKALPDLRVGKVENKEGMVRLRTILMDLSVKHAKVNEEDANMLAQLSREEAQAKRYANAAKGYKRAEKLYDRLEDDAGDRKDKEKQKEFDKKKDKASEREKKAERLSKGQDHKVGRWGPLPTIEKVTDDGDW